MKKSITKRIISIILCLSMVFGFSIICSATTRIFTAYESYQYGSYYHYSNITYNASMTLTYVDYVIVPCGTFPYGASVKFKVIGQNNATYISRSFTNYTTKGGSYSVGGDMTVEARIINDSNYSNVNIGYSGITY